jgi:hypothetical protein
MQIKVYVVEKRVEDHWEPITAPMKDLDDAIAYVLQHLAYDILRIVESVYETLGPDCEPGTEEEPCKS